ncbi:homoserine dehydrogenase [Neisseria sp. Ec49-e6-T10]|uniref:homoserine dehydrogenase n=1 Tax=Neisseria sp. Ec49-e6-T10 TaxID=3140744 RepID=UPI003EBEB0B0
MNPINVGLVGVGTVGGGTVQVLKKNAEEISRRVGRDIRLLMASSKDLDAAKQICGDDVQIVADAFEVVRAKDIDIVVELIGGTTIAKELILEAINHGKHVVTANKKLIAEYGNEIFSLAQQKQVMVMFEAAVAGGIPIIKTLREGLAANNIEWIAGIINGTSNFILTEMRDKGASFTDVLKEAQNLGYAEADPTFDIEGNDAGHKITIMSALAYGIPMQFDACSLEGISHLDGKDIKYAEELGYRVKLLGITRKTDQGIELRVHPTLIPESCLLANVNGVMNAVYVKGNVVGPTLSYGAGAGALPTASAVVADIIDIARLINTSPNNCVPYLAFKSDHIKNIPILPMEQIHSSYYLRICAKDEVGVLSEVTRLLAEQNISIEAVIQKDASNKQDAEIVILTHGTIEHNMNKAIENIEALSTTHGKVIRIRMEPFDA